MTRLCERDGYDMNRDGNQSSETTQSIASIAELVTKEDWTEEENQSYLEYLDELDRELEAQIAADETLAAAADEHLDQQDAYLDGPVDGPLDDMDEEPDFTAQIEAALALEDSFTADADALMGVPDDATDDAASADDMIAALADMQVGGTSADPSLLVPVTGLDARDADPTDEIDEDDDLFKLFGEFGQVSDRERIGAAIRERNRIMAKIRAAKDEEQRKLAEDELWLHNMNVHARLAEKACYSRLRDRPPVLQATIRKIISKLVSRAAESQRTVCKPSQNRSTHYKADREAALYYGVLTDWLPDILLMRYEDVLAYDPAVFVNELMTACNNGLAYCKAGARRAVTCLPPSIVAYAILCTRPIVLMDQSGLDTGRGDGRFYEPAVYVDPRDPHVVNEDTPRTHIDNTYDTASIETLIDAFVLEHDNKSKLAIREILSSKKILKRVAPNRDPDLIFAANCVLNKRTGTVMPYSPELYCTHHSPVNYVPSAPAPAPHTLPDGTVITFDEWLDDVFSAERDPGMHDLAWQMLANAIQPTLKTNKFLMLLSPVGQNGKGTFCSLQRSLIGEWACASIPMDQLGENFMATELIGRQALICDETDVGAYSERNATLKAIATQNVFTLRRMYHDATSMVARMLIEFCMNEMPATRDKSSSLYRRMLPIPFEKSFQGRADETIESVWLKRSDVLEYVFSRAAEMRWNGKYDMPASCAKLLGEVQQSNDSVRMFVAYALDPASELFSPDDPVVEALNAATIIKMSDLYFAYRNLALTAFGVPTGRLLTRSKFADAVTRVLPPGLEFVRKNSHATGRLLCNDTHNRLFFVLNTRNHSLSQHLRRTTVGATQRVCVADSPAMEQEIYVRPISQPAPDQEALRASLCARRSEPGAVGLLSDEEVIAIMQWWALYDRRRLDALQRFAPDTLNIIAMPDVPVPPLVHEVDHIRYSSYGPGR